MLKKEVAKWNKGKKNKKRGGLEPYHSAAR